MFLDRQERHANCVFSSFWNMESKRQAFANKELVRNLNEDAGAIASLRVATAGAAVGEIDQYLNALENNVVALFTANAGDKADPTSIMLMSRVIQSLCRGQAVFCLGARHRRRVSVQDR